MLVAAAVALAGLASRADAQVHVTPGLGGVNVGVGNSGAGAFIPYGGGPASFNYPGVGSYNVTPSGNYFTPGYGSTYSPNGYGGYYTPGYGTGAYQPAYSGGYYPNYSNGYVYPNSGWNYPGGYYYPSASNGVTTSGYAVPGTANTIANGATTTSGYVTPSTANSTGVTTTSGTAGAATTADATMGMTTATGAYAYPAYSSYYTPAWNSGWTGYYPTSTWSTGYWPSNGMTYYATPGRARGLFRR